MIWFLPSPRASEAGSAGPAQGRDEGCVWQGRTKGGSAILLENKLHPFSIFIRREDPERSSTRPRCV